MCITGGHGIDFGAPKAHTTSPTAWRQNIRRMVPHEHLFYEGDEQSHVYVIEKGWVKLYRTLIDGQRQVVGFCNGGTVLGLESESQHANGCEAITDVTVRAIPVSRFSEVCEQDPKLAHQLLIQLGRQLGAAQAQLTAVGSQSADQRLAMFLLAIADHNNSASGDEFDLPMRRGDMADFLGLRLETVSRKMSDFQRREWIRMTSLYRCKILRRALLQELAQGSDIGADGAKAA